MSQNKLHPLMLAFAIAIMCPFLPASTNLDGEPNRIHEACPADVPALDDDFRQPKDHGVFASFVLPTIVSIVPQLAGTALSAWSVKSKQLGLDMYRGIRCFELGARGLQRFYDYAFEEPKTAAELAVAEAEDHSLNRDMFGYLMADTIVQSTVAEMRPDLLIHHVMGLTLWGSALSLKIYPDIIAMNAAVEILSAFKGLEYTVRGKFLGDTELLRNQRILKAAYAFRLAVILGIRYPMWIFVDWPIPSKDYEKLGMVKWAVFRTLNVGILGLETLWLYQTARTFQRLRFF